MSVDNLPGRPTPFKFNITNLTTDVSLPVVPILLMHSGFHHRVIDEAVNDGARGLIIGVYGNGYRDEGSH